MTIPAVLRSSLRLPCLSGCSATLAVALLGAACSSRPAPHVPQEPEAQGRWEPGPLAAPYLITASRSEQRRWEQALAGSSIIVSYDDRGLVLLEGCTAPGVYGARRVQSSPVLAHLRGRDEIMLNMPAYPPPPQHEVLDDPMTIALLVTGEYANLADRVTRSTLSGECEGATHFVHRVELGVHAAAFGDAARFDSPQAVFREVWRSGDDELARCTFSSSGSQGSVLATDPSCARPLRVHLVALDAQASTLEERSVVEPVPCPAGTQLQRHRCAWGEAGAPHLCRLGDLEDCRIQCGLQHASSCNTLGWMLEHGIATTGQRDAAVEVYAEACAAGEGRGCLNLARLVAEDAPGRMEILLDRACQAGNPVGCARLASHYAAGTELPRRCDRAGNLLQRACRLGLPSACTAYAVGGDALGSCPGASIVHRASFLSAGCAAGDPRACSLRARGLLWDLCRASPVSRGNAQARAVEPLPALGFLCDQGHADACLVLGLARSYGRMPPTVFDPLRAAEAFERACQRGAGDGCARAARLLVEHQTSVADSAARIASLAERGCRLGQPAACLIYGARREAGEGCDRDLAVAGQAYEQACNGSIREACLRRARLEDDTSQAASWLARACPQEDMNARVPAACHELAVIWRQSTSDRARDAVELWRWSCSMGYEPACARWGDALMDGASDDGDPKHGEVLLRRACRQKEAWACERIEQRGLAPTPARRVLPPKVRLGRPQADPCEPFEIR